MASKDVRLVIKAQDQASRQVSAIADALKELDAAQSKLSGSSSKASGAIGALASDVARLKSESDKLESFGKVIADIGRSQEALGRLGRNLKASTSEFGRLRQEHAQVAASTKALEDRFKAVESAQSRTVQSIKDRQQALAQLRSEIEKSRKSQEAFNAAQAKESRRRVTIDPALKTREAELKKEIVDLRTTAQAAKAPLAELGNDLRRARVEEAALGAAAEKAGQQVLAARADLHQASTAMEGLQKAAGQAGAALGGLSANEAALAQASAATTARLEQQRQLLEAMNRLSGGRIGASEAAGLRRDIAGTLGGNAKSAAVEWQALEAQIRTLTTSMRAAGQATAEQEARLKALKDAARQMKTEFRQNSDALAQFTRRPASFAAFDQTAKAQQQARAAQQIAQASVQATNAQTQLAPATVRTAQATSQAAAATNNLRGAFLGLNEGSRQSLSLFQRLRGELLSLTAGAVGFYQAISQTGEAINAYRTLEAVQSRLGAVFKQDTSRVAKEVRFLKAEADRLGISFEVLGDTYGKFAIAANEAAFSQGATRDIFLAVAEAGRVNKLSLDQMKGTYLAIEQIISKGKFTSEEVRRQLGDRLPGAFAILARALGVTGAELDDMMRKGEVLATEENLLKFAEELNRRFGPQLNASLRTVTAEIGRFENNVFNARLAFAAGLVPGLDAALKAFNAFAQSAGGNRLFADLGTAAGKFLTVLAQIPQNFDLLVTAAQVFISIKLAGVLVGIGQRFLQVRVAMQAYAAQTAVASTATTRLGQVQALAAGQYAGLIQRIDRSRTALIASSQAAGTAHRSTTLLVGGLGFLRGALVTTATAVRALWSAFGGFAGIALTAITIAVGNWLTSVSTATSALREHQRQLEQVQQGYELVGRGAESWAKAVRGVTLAEAEQNLTELSNEFEARIRKITAAASGLRTLMIRMSGPFAADVKLAQGSDVVQAANEMDFLIRKFEEGSISLEAFAKGLDDVYKRTSDEKIKGLIQGLLGLINASEDGAPSMRDLSEAMEQQKEIVGVLKGEITELKDETEAVDETMGSTEGATKFEAALEKIRAKIPEIAKEMERLDKIKALDNMLEDAIKAAGGLDEIIKAIDGYKRARAAIEGAVSADRTGGANLADVARGFIGLNERDNAAEISALSREAGFNLNPQDTAWCAAFANAVLARRGMRGSGSLAARSFMDVGEAVPTGQEQVGDIAVFSRAGGGGHVGFIGEVLPDGRLRIIGGNQGGAAAGGGAVTEATFGRENLLGIRRPEAATGAQVAEAGQSITQEAVAAAEKAAEEAEKKRVEAEELRQEQADATKQRIEDTAFEIAQQKLINEEKGKQAAIEEALREAKAENPNITDEELARVREQTALLYEQQHQKDAINLAEEKVNLLQTQRNELLEQQKLLNEQGNMGGAKALTPALEQVNLKLREAIQNAIAMWQAIGGPEADAAIAKLNTMNISINAGAKRTGMFGLSMENVQSLAGSFADGLVGAFDEFGQALMKGENALQALANSFLKFAANFLREMATMILKQMIMNALQRSFPGLRLAGAPAGHTGGMVGSVAIGAGNRLGSRPQWATAALTYHQGGIAGLRPNEVQATLLKGEEVITQTDERHRWNQGGSREAKDAPRLKQVIAIGQKEIADAMASAPGEQVVVTHIQRNAPAIRRLLGM
jgi:uncharacterized protein (TIGR02594 family)